MNKKEWKLKEMAISKYHARLYHVVNNKVLVNPFGKLTDMKKTAEKEYQKTIFGGGKCVLGVHRSAQLLAILHVFDGLNSDHKVNDMFHIQLECLYGQALANKYRKEIEEEFTQEEINWYLENINYAEMQEEIE